MECPTLEKIRISPVHYESANNPAADIARIIHFYYGDDSYREYLRCVSPNIPFEALNSADRIMNYIQDIIKSGSKCLRRKRIFTVGHQGSGKSSLLHSMR